MTDLDAVKASADLLAIVSADLGPARRQSGRWYSWPCPLHPDSESDGGSLRVTSDNQRWYCFGCSAGGDVIEWIQQREGCSFVDAIEKLGGSSRLSHSGFRPRPPNGPRTMVEPKPPDDAWQYGAEQALTVSQATLWGPSTVGVAAREWLHQRGLADETIKRWGIGFNEHKVSLPEIPIEYAALARGIVIPVRDATSLWGVKVRQPDGFKPKYDFVKGSQVTLFGAENLTRPVSMLTEGEFDAMLACQFAGDLLGVASTSGGASTWQPSWTAKLTLCRSVLVAYDSDPAGSNAAVKVCSEIGDRAERVTVPVGKDVTEFWQRGGDIRMWIETMLGVTGW